MFLRIYCYHDFSSSSRSKHCMCRAHFPPYFQLVILDKLCFSQQVIKAKLSIKVIPKQIFLAAIYKVHQLKILKSIQGFENYIWAQCYTAIETYFLPKLCSCNKRFEIRWSHFRLHALSCIICNDDMKCQWYENKRKTQIIVCSQTR